MDNQLHEIRFHGRGGQGAVSAAALLSLAAFTDGFEAQAFPKFGSERRGAPVEAYVRISTSPIRRHNEVYKPHAVIIQDQTLLRSEPVTAGLVEPGLVILNAERCPDDVHNKSANDTENQLDSKDLRWVCLPANDISEALLGRPLPNTVLLGALVAVTEWVSLVALEQAIHVHLASKGEKIVAANIEALREGHRLGLLQKQQAEVASL